MINIQGKASVSLPPDAELPKLDDGRLKYPIAPDAYVPNSIVRNQMSFKPTPTDTFVAKERWKPKPVKAFDVVPELMSLNRSHSRESVRTPFTWASSEETPRTDLSLPSSAASTPRASTGDTAGRLNSNKLRERQDSGDEEKLRQQKLAKARASKTGTVTATKVDIGPTPSSEARSATPDYDLDDPAIPEEADEPETAVEAESADPDPPSDSPAVTPAVLRDLSREPWWPQDGELSVPGAVKVFADLMDTVQRDTFGQICDYIVRIHHELEYSDEDRDKLIRKLLLHTKSPDAQRREKAVSTLGTIGHRNSDSLVRALVPGLLDKDISVKMATAVALQKITGFTQKEDLIGHLDRLALLTPPEGKTLIFGSAGQNMYDEIVDLESQLPFDRNAIYAALIATMDGVVETNDGRTPIQLPSKRADVLTIDHGQVSAVEIEDLDDGFETEGSKQHTEEEYTPKLPVIQDTFNDGGKKGSENDVVVEKSKTPSPEPIRVKFGKDDSSGVSDFGMGHSSDASGLGRQDKASTLKEEMPRLSPIKSSMMEQSEDETPQENWRDFFETDSVKERRRLKEQQAAAAGAGLQLQGLPPIQYSTPKHVVIHGDAGVRMVQAVTISSPRKESDSARRYRINPIPGKLGNETLNTEVGSTKYGVIDMQWTSGVPFVPSPPTEQRLPQLPDHHHSYDNRLAQSENPSSSYLPEINRQTRLKGQGQGHTPGGHKVKDSGGQVYEWGPAPTPPMSHRPTRPSESKTHVHRAHNKHHCDYYRFIRKGMAQHIAVGRLLVRQRTTLQLCDMDVPVGASRPQTLLA